MAKAKVLLSASVVGTGQSPRSIANPISQIQLPPMPVPEFHGSYSDYMAFRETFDTLINQYTALTDIQRFYYLKSALKAEASSIIHNLPVSQANCRVAWQLLEERYQNNRPLINSHLRNIFDLPSITKATEPILRKFTDSLQSDIRSLKNLGEPVDEWGSMSHCF